MSCTSFHSIYFMPLLPQSRNSELLKSCSLIIHDIVQMQDALNLGAIVNNAANVQGVLHY